MPCSTGVSPPPVMFSRNANSLPSDARPRRRREPRRRRAGAQRVGAHLLAAAQAEHADRGGQLARELELALEHHRARRIDEQRDVHLLLLVKLLEIRPLDAREDVPVHEAHVVARRVIAVIAKLRARAALRREMLAAAAIREAPRSVQPQPREPVEVAIGQQRGDLRRRHYARSLRRRFLRHRRPRFPRTRPGTLRFSARPS